MASAKRINVLIYSGPGTSSTAVKHATWTLRRLLGSKYAVLPVTDDQVLKEPWSATCALFVMPGGADVGYCRVLNGEGNRRIKQYVQLGGRYLGFCAGGYYGSSKCEFEVGRKGMEVVGDRELAFFPGICRGLAFEGFVYQSEAGAKAVSVKPSGVLNLETFRSYYNGGGAFVNPEQFKDQGVEILASYTEDLHVDPGPAKAAVVYRKVGQGAAIVTGPHPEFSGANLNRSEPTNPNYPELVDALIADEKPRTAFLKALLSKLGLEVLPGQDPEPVPPLSPLHISASQPSRISTLLSSLREAGVLVRKPNPSSAETKGESEEEYLPCESNTFHLLPPPDPQTNPPGPSPSPPTQNSDPVSLLLHPHPYSLPDPALTPSFSHPLFFSSLPPSQTFGSILLYGEVVTSTSTLLEKNLKLLNLLPQGFVATATTQVAGRGRGSNVWVSPRGSLMFSVVLRHAMELSSSGKAPVVFVQYIAAMAVVRAIRGYGERLGKELGKGKGYEDLPVRVKWPNDVYVLDRKDGEGGEGEWVKVAGVLVSSSYAGGDFTLVVGIGVNVRNDEPTSSVERIARTQHGLSEGFGLEELLAGILGEFEKIYGEFCGRGWDRGFEEEYCAAWLHGGQVVTLEAEGGARARITGITRDWGMLVAEELGEGDRPTGRKWELRSDYNSFDFFKGLVKAKS